ncbi:hypothetical protein EHS25_001490 [Saitozyma podzolica]|uniref:Uncharacterized protein n=1 Tax=Saitozyma podzolica TaxID=1890683 RepID=A0A427YGC4_9TREE|nr:hypothetical protein EHS25_001490 [Saitozyma podzolica]
MPQYALHNLSQAIHTDGRPPLRFLLVSNVSESQWVVSLYSSAPDLLVEDEGAVAEAIKGGFLHVDLKGESDLNDVDKLSLELDRADVETGSGDLLEAAFQMLSRPSGPGTDSFELRSLRAQVSQKDDEIASLQAKLASMKATMVRATASDKKKPVISPKKPANASALQPNQKRRKVVEDEFAGSDDDD